LAGGLGLVFLGMIFSDTVCAEHRIWVLALASAAIIATVFSIVGLLAEWAGAPFITLATAGAGVAIGFIDALHAPTRGRLIALGFGVAVVLATWLAAKAGGGLRWHSSTLSRFEAPSLSHDEKAEMDRSEKADLPSGQRDSLARK